MRKKSFLLVSLFFTIICVSGLYSNEATVYSSELFIVLNYGSDSNDLGIEPGIDGAHPSEMFIDDEYLYIFDQKNQRIVFIDLISKQIESLELDNDTDFQHIEKIRVGNDNSIYGFRTDSDGSLFVKIDQEGKSLFSIRSSLFSNKMIYNNDYWIINNTIYFYGRDNNQYYIDSTGLIQKIDPIQFFREFNRLIQVSPNLIDFIDTKSVFLFENVLLTTNFLLYREFWGLMSEETLYNRFSRSLYFGHDKLGNSYWVLQAINEGKSYWYTFSPDGKQIDKFLIDMQAYEVVLAPNGDLYAKINNRSEEQFEIYHIPRTATSN